MTELVLPGDEAAAVGARGARIVETSVEALRAGREAAP